MYHNQYNRSCFHATFETHHCSCPLSMKKISACMFVFDNNDNIWLIPLIIISNSDSIKKHVYIYIYIVTLHLQIDSITTTAMAERTVSSYFFLGEFMPCNWGYFSFKHFAFEKQPALVGRHRSEDAHPKLWHSVGVSLGNRTWTTGLDNHTGRKHGHGVFY